MKLTLATDKKKVYLMENCVICCDVFLSDRDNFFFVSSVIVTRFSCAMQEERFVCRYFREDLRLGLRVLRIEHYLLYKFWRHHVIGK
jgi:hypothetical protein